MSRRRRPHYRSDLGWTSGVAFEGTLARPDRPAQGFTFVRCCGSPRASFPHGLTAPGMASHDDTLCVQLPPARGCRQLAPRRTSTSNPAPMPGTPPVGLRPPSVTPSARNRKPPTLAEVHLAFAESCSANRDHLLPPSTTASTTRLRRSSESAILAASFARRASGIIDRPDSGIPQRFNSFGHRSSQGLNGPSSSGDRAEPSSPSASRAASG